MRKNWLRSFQFVVAHGKIGSESRLTSWLNFCQRNDLEYIAKMQGYTRW